MKIKLTEHEKKTLNKHNLTIAKIKKLRVLDREQLKRPLFWRNDVVKAWCISEEVGHPEFCDETSYWIGIYDEDAPAYAGKFRIQFWTCGGYFSYKFKKFFEEKDIENDDALQIQIKFLAKINQLIDLGIIG